MSTLAEIEETPDGLVARETLDGAVARVARTYAAAEDDAIRRQLVALGWTPPGAAVPTDGERIRTELSGWLTQALDLGHSLDGIEVDLLNLRDWIETGAVGGAPDLAASAPAPAPSVAPEAAVEAGARAMQAENTPRPDPLKGGAGCVLRALDVVAGLQIEPALNGRDLVAAQVPQRGQSNACWAHPKARPALLMPSDRHSVTMLRTVPAPARWPASRGNPRA